MSPSKKAPSKRAPSKQVAKKSASKKAARKSTSRAAGSRTSRTDARATTAQFHEPPPLVQLRGAHASFDCSPEASHQILRLSADWSYTLRMRSRWAHDPDLRAVISEYAVEALSLLGFDADVMRQLATSERLQVVLADSSIAGHAFHDADHARDVVEAAFAFPWEYVLSAATRCLGRTQGVLITRCLADGRPPHPDEVGAGTLTIVTSAPGRIGDVYSFDSEILRLGHAVGANDTSNMVFPPSDRTHHTAPPRSTHSALAAYMNALPANDSHFVHVSGVDPIQAAALIPDLYADPARVQPGGMLMAREVRRAEPGMTADGVFQQTAREQVVSAVDLAEALIPTGKTPPALVTLNLHYSGAHTAPEMLRRGAQVSIGFLDTIPDEVAEYFFTVFYRECQDATTLTALAEAFGRAWVQLDEQGHDLHGTGIVLWMCTCEPVEEINKAIAARADDPAVTFSTDDDADQAALKAELQRSREQRVSEVLAVDVDVPSEINYSLLHNRRSALKTFTLSKLVDHDLDDVRVEVELEAGGVVQQFRRTLSLSEPHVALADAVTLPLTAPLLRSLHERTHTTVYTRVTWEGRVAHEDTHRVALLPVDEWYDDSKNNPWLPSFVLPRDPAIARIIGEARKYLVALTDDTNAGFDGYQQVDDPDGGAHATDRTDLQVQAIWTALVNDRKLLYINPPPAYSRGGQRLRTPSELLHTSSGTCIDLSLLLAACLEYVEIHACLVLITGHCFVGYWRADAYQEEFMTVARPPEGRVRSLGESAFRSGRIELVDPYGWRVGPQGYDELQGYVRADALCLLESTGLCFGYPFAQAQQEGLDNLADRNAFDSLLDIRVARRSSPPVTPLPIIAGER